MLGVIVKVMKNVLVSGAKRIGKAFSFSAITSIIGRRSMVHLRRIGTKMLTNMKSAKWWARAVRYIRRSGLVSSVGSTGAALKQAGANNWITKGMSAFKYDARSPKEYHAELERKTKLIESLKKKRDSLNERALEVQGELSKPPLDVSKIPDAGAKIDALAGSINQMRSGLAEVKATSSVTLSEVKGFQEGQTQANAALGEVILQTSEGNMKVQLEGFEDMKSHNMAMHAETTENITSDITAHIDALEEQKKAEEEERRKNDWKRKFLENLLLILEWILDFPNKIKMLFIKIGLIIVAGLAAVVLANLGKMKAFFAGSLKDQLGYLLARVTQFIAWIYQGLEWVRDTIMDGLEYVDPTGLVKKWRAAEAAVKETLGLPSPDEIRQKAKDEAEAAMKRMEANYASIESQKRDVANKSESVGKDIKADDAGKTIIDTARLTVKPPPDNLEPSTGNEKELKKPKKSNKPEPKPFVLGELNTPGSEIFKSEEPKVSTKNAPIMYIEPNSTTANIPSAPKLEMESSTIAEVAPNKDLNSVTKEDLESTAMALAKANQQTNDLIKESSKATMMAAASKTPNVQNVDYNFKKASTEIKSAIG
jgi:hypothetical protein